MMLPSAAVHALGMGEIEVRSALNEPLNAQIKLLSTTAAELSALQVALASNEVFGRMGIDPSPSLRDIRFEVVTQGAGAPYVRVASTTPIREPFLDLILTASWANGQLVREYTLLLDPPVFDEAQPAAPVQAARTESSAISRGKEKEAVAAKPAAAPAAPRASTSEGSYGPTKRTDTLWTVARDMRPDSSVDVPRMMMAIMKENPEAFIGGNANNMKAGQILRAPSMEVINSISSAQAAAEVNRHYQEWQAASGRSPAAPARQQVASSVGSAGGATAAAPAPVANGSARLKLLTPEESKQQAGSGSAGQGKDAVMGQLALALETAEATKQENAELKARLADLERQLQAVQRLLTLKGDTLGALQAGAGQAPDVLASPAPEETAPVDAGVEAGLEAQAGAEGAVDPAPEAQPQVESKPAPAAPVVAQDEPAQPGLLDDLLANPTLLGAAVGGPLLLLLVGALIRRRRQQAESDSAERLFAAATAPTSADDLMPQVAPVGAGIAAKKDVEDNFGDMIDASVGADVTPTAAMGSIHAEESEIDPIAEADVYLAYRRYEQAEALLKDAIRNDPDRSELKLKLLEIYFTTKDKDAFEAQAEGLYAALGGQHDDVWSQAVEMGREISPDHPLFAESESAASHSLRDTGIGSVAVAGAAVAGAAVAGAVAADDEFSFDLSDDDLAKSLEMPSLDATSSDADLLDLDMLSEEKGDLLAFDENDLEAAAAEAEEFSLDGDLVGGDDPDLSLDHGLDLSDTDMSLLDQPADGDELRLDDDLTSGFDLDSLESIEPVAETPDESDAATAAALDEWTLVPAVSSFTSRDIKTEMDDGYVPEIAAVADVSAVDAPGQLDLADTNFSLDDGTENNLFDSADDIVGTKLDLARAYIEMGDEGGARSILDEVVKEGGDTHRQEAEQLMRQIS